jgi:hypothetical protein
MIRAQACRCPSAATGCSSLASPIGFHDTDALERLPVEFPPLSRELWTATREC